jgi:hypothetical protein
MRKLFTTLGAVALVLGAAGAAQAVSLTDLLAGGSITIGDKLFDDWQEIFQDKSDFTTVNTDNIDVTALADNGSGYGLRFDIQNNELFVQGDDLYAYTDYSFGFRVSVLDPRYKIKDASLEGFIAGWGFAVDGFNDVGSYLLENIGTAAGLDDLGILDAESSVLDDVSYSDAGGAVDFAPQSELWVTKNLFVWAVDSTDDAFLAGFDQRFSQVPIPEPSTWLLMGLGLVGLMGAGRKLGVRA